MAYQTGSLAAVASALPDYTEEQKRYLAAGLSNMLEAMIPQNQDRADETLAFLKKHFKTWPVPANIHDYQPIRHWKVNFADGRYESIQAATKASDKIFGDARTSSVYTTARWPQEAIKLAMKQAEAQIAEDVKYFFNQQIGKHKFGMVLGQDGLITLFQDNETATKFADEQPNPENFTIQPITCATAQFNKQYIVEKAANGVVTKVTLINYGQKPPEGSIAVWARTADEATKKAAPQP